MRPGGRGKMTSFRPVLLLRRNGGLHFRPDDPGVAGSPEVVVPAGDDSPRPGGMLTLVRQSSFLRQGERGMLRAVSTDRQTDFRQVEIIARAASREWHLTAEERRECIETLLDAVRNGSKKAKILACRVLGQLDQVNVRREGNAITERGQELTESTQRLREILQSPEAREALANLNDKLGLPGPAQDGASAPAAASGPDHSHKPEFMPELRSASEGGNTNSVPAPVLEGVNGMPPMGGGIGEVAPVRGEDQDGPPLPPGPAAVLDRERSDLADWLNGETSRKPY
jgi:hypothetical protein